MSEESDTAWHRWPALPVRSNQTIRSDVATFRPPGIGALLALGAHQQILQAAGTEDIPEVIRKRLPGPTQLIPWKLRVPDFAAGTLRDLIIMMVWMIFEWMIDHGFYTHIYSHTQQSLWMQQAYPGCRCKQLHPGAASVLLQYYTCKEASLRRSTTHNRQEMLLHVTPLIF